MSRTGILARELRGITVVVLVALLILWLFGRLTDDRAEAQARHAALDTTTTTVAPTTSSTAVPINDRQRLCSLSTAFREDLRALPAALISPSGNPLTGADDPVIDIGLHSEGDIIRAGVEPLDGNAVPPPSIVNTDRIDPVASGLLGEPQQVALTFYTAAAALRLGLIDADFDATSSFLADFVSIGEPAAWNIDELLASDFSDRWTALPSQSVTSVDATLVFIEQTCAVRIGNGFVYREREPELDVFEPVFVPGDVDPSLLPTEEPTGEDG